MKPHCKLDVITCVMKHYQETEALYLLCVYATFTGSLLSKSDTSTLTEKVEMGGVGGKWSQTYPSSSAL